VVLCFRVSALCRRPAGRPSLRRPIGPSRPRGSSEGSRGAGFRPQVVNSLGTIQLTGTWAAHRWKAPRVRRIPLPLRGGTGEAALGSSSRPGRGFGSIRSSSAVHATATRTRKRERGWGSVEQEGRRARRKLGLRGGIAEAFVPHVAHAGCVSAAPGSPAGAAKVPRQEVPEWIGLGRSSCCARSSEPTHGRRHPPSADGP